jgi:hypothetical protein
MFFRNDRVCAPGPRCRAPSMEEAARETPAARRASSGLARRRLLRDFDSFVSASGGVFE